MANLEKMEYEDSYSEQYQSEEAMFRMIRDSEKRGKWLRVPADELVVMDAEEGMLCDTNKEREIYEDARENVGLLLLCGGKRYPMGETGLPSLQNRARISGNALKDVSKTDRIEILNLCLKVAKGDALVRVSEGKVRAVHGGDERDYAVISMAEIFRQTSEILRRDFGSVHFGTGERNHRLTTAYWTIVNPDLFEVYRKEMAEAGIAVGPYLRAAVRVTTSDVGASGVNLSYLLMEGSRKVVLGQNIRLNHRNGATLEDFKRNLSQVFSLYKQALRGLSELTKKYVDFPVTVAESAMKKVGIPAKIRSEVVSQYEAVNHNTSASYYEVYTVINDAVFVAKVMGYSERQIAELEEKIARCLSFDWKQFDMAVSGMAA